MDANEVESLPQVFQKLHDFCSAREWREYDPYDGLNSPLARFLYLRTTPIFPRFHNDAHYEEFTIRRLRPQTPFWHTSIDGQWEFRINAQGFRADKNDDYEKPPGCQRVLCLGDSQTEGFECRQEHTVSAIIERYFAVRRKCVEAINTGVSGFGTAEELVLLENEGVKFHPDFVVLVFFGNDLEDNTRCDIFGVKNGALVTNTTTYIPGVKIPNRIDSFALLRWLSQYSYLYSRGVNGVWEYERSRLETQNERKLTSEMAVQNTNTTTYVAVYQKDLEATLLRRMCACCQAHGAKLIILDIPELVDPSRPSPDFKPSIPPDLRDTFRQNCDVLIESEPTLAEYRGLIAVHVPQGHYHMSEKGHLLFGIQAAKAMERLAEKKPGS
jgi:hypothetical protein